MKLYRREILKIAGGAAVIAAASSFSTQFLQTAYALILAPQSLLQAARIAGFPDTPISAIQVANKVGMAPPFSFKQLFARVASDSLVENCAVCNDGSCQCGKNQTDNQLCANNNGVDQTLGCDQTP